MNIDIQLAEYRLWKERLLTEYPDLVDDHETLADTLEGCTSLLDALCGIARAMDDDLMAAEGIKQRIAVLDERRKAAEARAERKRDLIERVMIEEEIRRLPMSDMTISTAKRPPKLIVVDEAALSDEWFNPQPAKLDRTRLTKALKDGAVVEGAVLSNGDVGINIRRGA